MKLSIGELNACRYYLPSPSHRPQSHPEEHQNHRGTAHTELYSVHTNMCDIVVLLNIISKKIAAFNG